MLLAASCSFVTPFSYQTNMMVSQVAGYKVLHFMRFGGPLLLICMVVVCTLATTPLFEMCAGDPNPCL